jgi:glycosyltransferase involved in cell wall biosynthesis
VNYLSSNTGKVSIIMPTHNRCDLLKNAIDSILNQTYKNYEIIIVDDASTDNTEEYINSLNLDKLVYIKNKESKGASKSRSIGIRNATGQFIAFLDDDDEWLPTKLEEQVKKFSNNDNLGLVYTGVKLVFKDQNLSYNTLPNLSGYVYKEMLMRNHIGVTPAVMLRKEVLEDVGLFDSNYPAREEYDLWIRVSEKWKIDYIKEPLLISYGRINLDRISSDVNNYKKAIDIMNQKYKNDILELTLEEQKIRIANQYFFLGSQAIKVNNSSLARKYFINSIKEKFSVKTFLAVLASFFGFKGLVLSRLLYGKLKG